MAFGPIVFKIALGRQALNMISSLIPGGILFCTYGVYRYLRVLIFALVAGGPCHLAFAANLPYNARYSRCVSLFFAPVCYFNWLCVSFVRC